MSNPFEVLEHRLTSIESILLEIANKPNDLSNKNEVEKIFTIQEASEFLSLKVPTLYSKVHKNEIPFMKKGNRLYFSKSELLDYIKEGRNTTYKDAEQVAETHVNNQSKAIR